MTTTTSPKTKETLSKTQTVNLHKYTNLYCVLTTVLLVKCTLQIVTGTADAIVLVISHFVSLSMLAVIRIISSNTIGVALFYCTFLVQCIGVVCVKYSWVPTKSDDLNPCESAMVLAYVYLMVVPVYVNALVYVGLDTVFLAVGLLSSEDYAHVVELCVIMSALKILT